ncbi:MAG: type II toxin-antitoxin system YafQ family toxin [bacterium]|nr:type II toxin-antitoxin system YafQ family toxin [bacterium]
MKRTHPQGPFRRDLKRLSKRGWDIEKLQRVIILLQRGDLLPSTARPHKLSGEYAGLWECHVESDWLLIYDVTEKEVFLVRTGKHIDLFG